MINTSVTIEETVALLNGLLKLDTAAVTKLVENRVECNEALANHPTVQVNGYDEPGKYKVGLLGILNGLFGVDERGWGAIAVTIDDSKVCSFSVRATNISSEVAPMPAKPKMRTVKEGEEG